MLSWGGFVMFKNKKNKQKNSSNTAVFSQREIQQMLDLLASGSIKKVQSLLTSKIRPKKEVKERKYTEDPEFAALTMEQKAEVFKNKLITNQTEAEKTFKAILKSAEIEYSFQHIIFYRKTTGAKSCSFYIADFYLPRYNTIVEIDGGYHDSKEQKKIDKERTKAIKNNGIAHVKRYTNNDVLTDQSFILADLKNWLIVPVKQSKVQPNTDIIVYKGRNYKRRVTD